MSNIAMVSCFSTSTHYLDRYLAQADALRALLSDHFHHLTLIAVEGDSRDDTRAQLAARLAPGDLLIDGTHNRHVWHSVEHPERMRNLAHVWNCGFSAIAPDCDVVLYVDSDLIYQPRTVLALVNHVLAGRDVVAPLVFAGEHFYDVFCYRALPHGERFSPFPPYSHTLLSPPTLTEVWSVGAFFACKGEVARRASFHDDDCVIGFCRHARALNYRVWVDPSLRVEHPA